MLCVSGNFSRYLKTEDKDDFVISMAVLPYSAGVVFGIGFGFPLLLSVMMKLFGSEKFKFVEVFTIYGYSYTSFILTAFLCAFPIDTI